MTGTLVARRPGAAGAPPATPALPDAPGRDRGYAAGVAGITAAGLVFRVALVGHLPYWRDEAFTAVTTRSSWTGMLDTVRNDSAPPLGYILGHLASSVSTVPVSLRMVSALAGTASIPIAAALARRAGGDRAGLCGAAVTAVMPTLVVISRDVRMYALATTLVLLAALTLIRALERPGAGRLALHGAVVALAVHTHYLAALGVVALLAAAALLRPTRGAWLRAAAATGAGCLTLVPWLIAARAQFEHSGFWIPPLSPGVVQDVTTEFFRGSRVGFGVLLGWEVQGAAVAAGAAAFLGLIAARRRLPIPARRQAAFLAAAGLGGTLVLLLISTRRPLFDSRYAGVLWAPLIPLLGAGAARLRPRLGGAAVVAVLGLCSATVLATTQRTDWPTIAGWLDTRVGPGDQLVLNSPDYLLIVQYADPATVARTRVLNPSGPPWFWGTAAYPPGAVVGGLSPGPATFWVAGDWLPPVPVPAGYRQAGPAQCVAGYCVTPFTR